MGNEQVFCLLKGRKKDQRKKEEKTSCLSKTDPSEPGLQLRKGSTAWLCRWWPNLCMIAPQPVTKPFA